MLQGSHRNSSVVLVRGNRPGGRTRRRWVTFSCSFLLLVRAFFSFRLFFNQVFIVDGVFFFFFFFARGGMNFFANRNFNLSLFHMTLLTPNPSTTTCASFPRESRVRASHARSLAFFLFFFFYDFATVTREAVLGIFFVPFYLFIHLFNYFCILFYFVFFLLAISECQVDAQSPHFPPLYFVVCV